MQYDASIPSDVFGRYVVSESLVLLAQASLDAVHHASWSVTLTQRQAWLDDAIRMTGLMGDMVQWLDLPPAQEEDFWQWINESEDRIWSLAGQ